MPESASKRIDQPWIDLLSALSDKGHNQGNGLVSVTLNSRNELIARLFNVLVECLLEYNKTGFSSFEKDWRKLDLLTGRNVYIRAGNEEVEAKVLGFGSDYSLRVDVNGKEKMYYAADIKLKIKEYADN